MEVVCSKLSPLLFSKLFGGEDGGSFLLWLGCASPRNWLYVVAHWSCLMAPGLPSRRTAVQGARKKFSIIFPEHRPRSQRGEVFHIEGIQNSPRDIKTLWSWSCLRLSCSVCFSGLPHPPKSRASKELKGRKSCFPAMIFGSLSGALPIRLTKDG